MQAAGIGGENERSASFWRFRFGPDLMLRSFFSVGGFTLLSRLTGFVRDLVIAAILGAGAVNDAFVVAFKLPNQFRSEEHTSELQSLV